MFLIRITCRVDLAMAVCVSVRMNAKISETIRARLLGIGMQIPEQRKFFSPGCHDHSNAHKPPKNCGFYSFNARIKIWTENSCFNQYLSIDSNKNLARPMFSQIHKNCRFQSLFCVSILCFPSASTFLIYFLQIASMTIITNQTSFLLNLNKNTKNNTYFSLLKY